MSRADATRITRDAPKRRAGRYLRNPSVAPRAGPAGTRGPTATRVPAFAWLAGTVEGANERVAHGMFTKWEARVEVPRGSLLRGGFRAKNERGRRELFRRVRDGIMGTGKLGTVSPLVPFLFRFSGASSRRAFPYTSPSDAREKERPRDRVSLLVTKR